ncbi:DUF4349 domain-containing protein [Cesiribacter andamanensis]|uniref:DUF4349 domain-containing protein n=1 Tax=Cesiribacter andamanensis AMV16 TaxID=1279009 RepID=M7N5C2_9BACT|nr:DUF4349 domain-containing protein [Cesiribacter andamanensis]EMR03808.1 hypothetical protein ADICEAN_01049 [Cesiribacter andamanensis AMV16]
MKAFLPYPLILLLALAACEGSGSGQDYTERASEDVLYDIPMTEQPAPPMEYAEELAFAPEARQAGGPSGPSGVTQPPVASSDTIQKQIIKTASLVYEVKQLQQAQYTVDSLVKRLGGYISSSNQNNSSQRHELNLSLRIPSARFDALMQALAALPERIDHQSVEARDVTEEYIDLRSRLQTKKKVEKRYQELLQKANTVKEILEVEEKLRQLQEEIEAKEGQLRYLTHQVSYSTIHLNMYEVQKFEYLPSRSPHFGQRILGALDGGWQLLLNLVLGLAYLWPLALVVAVAVPGIRAYRRRRQRGH